MSLYVDDLRKLRDELGWMVEYFEVGPPVRVISDEDEARIASAALMAMRLATITMKTSKITSGVAGMYYEILMVIYSMLRQCTVTAARLRDAGALSMVDELIRETTEKIINSLGDEDGNTGTTGRHN